MLRANRAAVAGRAALIVRGAAGRGDARSLSVQIHGAARTEVKNGGVETRCVPRCLKARLAFLDRQREMVGPRPARRCRRTEPDFGVAQRPPQFMEQRL